MVRLTSGRIAARIIIGLCFWLLSSQDLVAHSPVRVLVVVADAADAACVQRIGREHVQVELLFAPETGVQSSNYQACAKRVRGLLNFQMFVFRSDSPSQAFWRERMAAANPRGKLHRLTQSRYARADDRVSRMQRASEVHRALAAIMPKRRASLDANLKAELRRLRMLRESPSQLALVELNNRN